MNVKNIVLKSYVVNVKVTKMSMQACGSGCVCGCIHVWVGERMGWEGRGQGGMGVFNVVFEKCSINKVDLHIKVANYLI